MTGKAIRDLIRRIDRGCDHPAATLAGIRRSLSIEAHRAPSLEALRDGAADAAWAYGQQHGMPVRPDKTAQDIVRDALERLDDQALAELVVKDEDLYNESRMSSRDTQDSVARVLSDDLQDVVWEVFSDIEFERASAARDKAQAPSR